MIHDLILIIHIFIIKATKNNANEIEIRENERKTCNNFHFDEKNSVRKHYDIIEKVNEKFSIQSDYCEQLLDLSQFKTNKFRLICKQNEKSETDNDEPLHLSLRNIEQSNMLAKNEFTSENNCDSLVAELISTEIRKNIPFKIHDSQTSKIEKPNENQKANGQQVKNHISKNSNISKEEDNYLFQTVEKTANQKNAPDDGTSTCILSHKNFLKRKNDMTFSSKQSLMNMNKIMKQEVFDAISNKRTPIKQKYFQVQKSIFNDNNKFINDISDFFNFNASIISDNDLSVILSDLQKFVENYINNMTDLSSEQEYSIISDTVFRRMHLNVSNLKNCCPFCSVHKFHEDLVNEKEEKLNLDLHKSRTTLKLTNLIQQFLREISDFTKEPFKPVHLFFSKFFKTQRIILDNILHSLDTKMTFLDRELQIKYVHFEYHKLFFNNIEMKLFYLPELLSILYVMLKNKFVNEIKRRSQNSIIMFYTFYSLNKIFDWINDFHETNKTLEYQKNISLSRFIPHLISFIIRISFIEPILSLFKIHQNAQFRYHFLSLNIFYDELCIFLNRENKKKEIVENSKLLLPFIILVEEYTIENTFEYFLKHDLREFGKSNIFNFQDFRCFLNFMPKTNIQSLIHPSKKLKNSLIQNFLT